MSWIKYSQRIIKLWPFHDMDIGRIDDGFWAFIGGGWVVWGIAWKWRSSYERGVPPDYKHQVRNTVSNLFSKGEAIPDVPFNTVNIRDKSIRQD